MKKIYFKHLLLLITISIFTFACNYDNNSKNNESTIRSSPLKQISSYNYLGDIHNEYMQEACLTFDGDKIASKEDGLNYISSFLREFEPSDDNYHEEISESLIEFEDWSFLVEEQKKEKALSQEIQDGLTKGVELDIIDDFEKQLLTDILNLANENLTLEELNDFIDEKINLWESQGYTEDNHLGAYSAIVLAISKRSTEWWILNSECLSDIQSRWIWLATDAAGAAIGAAAGIITHEISGSEHTDISGSIVAGAVVGSLGLAGRVGKLISKLWP